MSAGRPDETLPWPGAEAIDAVVEGRHGDPFSVLGMHAADGRLRVAAWQPGAERVEVLDLGGKAVSTLERVRPAGFFAGEIPRRRVPFRYRLRVARGAMAAEIDDPYAFPPLLGQLDAHLMGEGTHQELFGKLGAHRVEIEGVAGTAFAVWAPNARRASVVGDFNDWDERRHPMRRRVESGVWELFVPGVGQGALYKFNLLGPGGEALPAKADPFAFSQEAPPATASRVQDRLDHRWQDGEWLAARAGRDHRASPMTIYEVHLGSWRRRADGGMPDYDELADTLVPYARDMGFTHIEVLPVAEHPFSGSWGYQPIGLFAPTARFGPPEGFARLVDRCHREGIGLLVDWVPAHFPSDAHGLARFDGTALYEHEDPRQGFHRDWNTLIYNLGRREVANFLQANALFWLDRYHVDGLRVDAVASMLYLDYSRQAGDWVPNAFGGNENLEAIAFLREVNRLVHARRHGVLTIAEESTSWPQVSRPVEVGGLGFGFKWNMGWMHDTLDYMAHEPVHRRYHHHQLTFGLLYAFSENFVLPLSHDEVVHGKRSLLGRMPGDRWQRFANLRAYYGFMWGHPGKKLLFMGGELAQEKEWNHDTSLDWHLLEQAEHRGVQLLVRDLNLLVRDCPALHQRDCEATGFEWIDANDADQSVISFARHGSPGTAPAIVVCNFTPVVRRGYRIGAPRGGRWIERLNTDAACYGGSNVGNGGAVDTEAQGCHGRDQSLLLTLPPLATLVFEHDGGRHG